MIIYPNGKGHAKQSRHISVCLAISEESSLPCDWEVNAICTIFLLNQLCDKYRAVRGQVRCFQSIKSEWGLPEFLPHETFTDPSNGYLVDGKCVFGAEIFVIQRKPKVECLSLVRLNDTYNYQWEIPNFCTLEDNWLSKEVSVGDHKWQLSIYPRGDEQNRGKNMSIFLHCVDAKDFDHHQKVKAQWKICVKDQKSILGYGRESSYCAWFTSSKLNWGYPKFLPLTELHNWERGYIHKDCMVVELELKVLLTQRITSLYPYTEDN